MSECFPVKIRITQTVTYKRKCFWVPGTTCLHVTEMTIGKPGLILLTFYTLVVHKLLETALKNKQKKYTGLKSDEQTNCKQKCI